MLCRRAADDATLNEVAKRDLLNHAIFLEAQSESRSSEPKKWLQARTALVTFIFANASALNYVCPQHIKIVAEATVYLQGMTSLKAFFGRFVGWVERTGEERLKCVQWAASAELCADTFVKERVLRIHLHASWRCKIVMVVRTAKTLIFEGLVPHYDGPNIGGVSLQGVQESLGAKKENETGRTGAQNAAFYYLQCEAKIGSIFRQGTKEPFLGYPCKAAWITI